MRFSQNANSGGDEKDVHSEERAILMEAPGFWNSVPPEARQRLLLNIDGLFQRIYSVVLDQTFYKILC